MTWFCDEDSPLEMKLRKMPGEVIEPIPQEYLRKFIAYSRQWVFPTLSKEARDELQNFYLELRQRHQIQDLTPITLRQLESLVRLTEARARMELKEEATAPPAREVIKIMRSSMSDTLGDGRTGSLDFSRASNGSGMSSRGAARKFVNALQRQAEILQKSKFRVEEMKETLRSCGCKVANFFDFFESLNNQGYLLKKSRDVYQLLTVDF